jgi:aminoglycoside 3-N-acetyltransferase
MSFVTRRQLAAELGALGLGADDTVMVHAGLRSIGPMLGGPDSLIDAILDATAPGGTLLVYTDWNEGLHELADADGHVPAEIRDHVRPFDPLSSRAIRDNGAFPELVRTRPGARRSGNPGASCAAIGARAEWLTSGHALDYGYGGQSPFAKLVEVRGKVLMIGAPLDTMTILHHAEHKASIPGKRVVRFEVPLARDGRTEWRSCEEFDTSRPVADGLAEDYFAGIVEEFLAKGRGRRGNVGNAASVLVPAAEIVGYAVNWLERRMDAHRSNGP